MRGDDCAGDIERSVACVDGAFDEKQSAEFEMSCEFEVAVHDECALMA